MTSTDLQAELAPVKRRDKEAQAAWRSASLVYQDASAELATANREVIRLTALMMPLRDWLLDHFDDTITFGRPQTIATLAKQSHRPADQVAPDLAEHVAEGLIRQVGKGYLPPDDQPAVTTATGERPRRGDVLSFG